MIAAGVVVLLAVASSPVRVVHDGCPSGAEVELALASMLAPPASPGAAPPARRDVARLERQSDERRGDARSTGAPRAAQARRRRGRRGRSAALRRSLPGRAHADWARRWLKNHVARAQLPR
ncbi:MAG TPA: hypothetical protein VIF57_28830 [Polyangia bacterium]